MAHESEDIEKSDIIGGILSVGSTLATGALAFAGMMAFTASLPWGVAAFVLAAAIEGQIYKDTITKALKTLFDNPPEAEKIKKLKKLRRALKKQLKEDPQADHLQQQLNQLNLSIEKKQSTLSKKFIAKIIGAIFCIGAGVALGFTSLAAATSGFLSIGVSAAIVSVAAPLIAVFAGIGYALMLYRHVQMLIHDNWLNTWYKKARDFFAKKDNETTPQWLGRTILPGIGAALIVAIAVFATIATAGTWWYAAKEGALLVKGVSDAAASVIRTITVLMVPIPTALFSIIRSLQSGAKLFTANYGDALSKAFAPAGKAVLNFNLFAFISTVVSLPLQAAIFVGHLIAIGLMSDRLPGVHPAITTAVGTINEFNTDVDFLIDSHHHHHHHPLDQPEVGFFRTLLNVILYGYDPKNHHQHEHHHHGDKEFGEHHHSNLPTIFINILLSPINLLAYTWNKINPITATDMIPPVPEQSDSDHSHGSGSEDECKHHHHHASPTSSPTWRKGTPSSPGTVAKNGVFSDNSSPSSTSESESSCDETHRRTHSQGRN